MPHRLHVVCDGEECLDYLFQRRAYADPARSPRPHLLMADCEMRRGDGWEVLAAVKASVELRPLPVILIDTDLSEAQIRKAYEMGASSVFSKPAGREALTEFLRCFTAYWAGAMLPRMGQNAQRAPRGPARPGQ